MEKWITYVCFPLIVLFLSSCGGSDEKSNTSPEEQEAPAILDPNQGLVTSVDGKQFALPSPIQLAQIIQTTGAKYDAKLVNKTSNADKYVTKKSKALNFGVYGTDIGYMTSYSRTTDVINYMKVMKNIGESIDVARAFDEETFDALSDNIADNNVDSLLVLVSGSFRKGNQYLKENGHDDIAALVLVGTWVESMYIASTIALFNPTQDLKNRIGEQRYTIDDVCDLLAKYYNTDDELLIQMNELRDEFRHIYVSFLPSKSTHDSQTHMSEINGSSKANLSEEQLKSLQNQISQIRNIITES